MKKLNLLLICMIIAGMLSGCGSSSETVYQSDVSSESIVEETAVPEISDSNDRDTEDAVETDVSEIADTNVGNTDDAEMAEVSETADSNEINADEAELAEASEIPDKNDISTDETRKTAVVYFSGTGNTRAVAEALAEVTGSDLYEIVPAEEYTDEDLNYRNDDCRANKEQDDPDERPAIENDLSQVTDYQTVYLGHPIWWGTNPRIIQTFLDTYDLSNAKIYTFCTSGGSGIETSLSELQENYPELNIISGQRFDEADPTDIEQWVMSLE